MTKEEAINLFLIILSVEGAICIFTIMMLRYTGGCGI